jgi:hypothetical protein
LQYWPAALSQGAPQSAQSVSTPRVTHVPVQHFWYGTIPTHIMTGRVQAAELPHLHAPSTQASASSALQTVVHDPQWAMSSVVSMHAPSQHNSPAGQCPPVVPQTQLPALQVSPAPQAVPHAPQLAGSIVRFRQPSGQQIDGETHSRGEPWHEQCAVPDVGFTHESANSGSSSRQRVPQEPQLSVSESTFVHASPQHRSGATQAGVQAEMMHVPLSQIWPLGQALPHRPQLVRLVRVSTQPRPQHVRPVLHPGSHPPLAQTPSRHASAAGHAFSQLPQCSGSLSRSAQAAPQQTLPNVHDVPPHWHSPRAQVPSLQLNAQTPQLCGSFNRSTQSSSPQVAGAATLHSGLLAAQCAAITSTPATATATRSA